MAEMGTSLLMYAPRETLTIWNVPVKTTLPKTISTLAIRPHP